MKKFLALLLFWSSLALPAEQIPYGVAHTFDQCFYDYATGIDLESTITWADADITISQNGTEGGGTGANMTDNGTCFSYALASTETDTARVTVIMADAAGDVWLPVHRNFVTIDHPDAGIPCPAGDCITYGTAQSGTTTTVVLAAATNLADDLIIGARIEIVGGTGADQYRTVADYVQSTDTITPDEAFNPAPDSTSKYFVRRDNRAIIEVDASGYVSSNVQTVVGAAVTTIQANLATAAGQTTTQGAISDLTDGTTPVHVSTMGTGSIAAGTFAASAINAAALAADAGTEIATAVGNIVIEDQGSTYTWKCSQAVLLSVLAGEATTSSSPTFSDPSGAETRLTATVSGTTRNAIVITCP